MALTVVPELRTGPPWYRSGLAWPCDPRPALRDGTKPNAGPAAIDGGPPAARALPAARNARLTAPAAKTANIDQRATPPEPQRGRLTIVFPFVNDPIRTGAHCVRSVNRAWL